MSWNVRQSGSTSSPPPWWTDPAPPAAPALVDLPGSLDTSDLGGEPHAPATAPRTGEQAATPVGPATQPGLFTQEVPEPEQARGAPTMPDLGPDLSPDLGPERGPEPSPGATGPGQPALPVVPAHQAQPHPAQPHPAPDPAPAACPPAVDPLAVFTAASKAMQFAACFAWNFLSWDECEPTRRATALAPYLGEDVARTNPGWHAAGYQRVLAAQPALVQTRGELTLIDVHVLVTPLRSGSEMTCFGTAEATAPPAQRALCRPSSLPEADWQRLLVPVARRPDGRLVVELRPDQQQTRQPDSA